MAQWSISSSTGDRRIPLRPLGRVYFLAGGVSPPSDPSPSFPAPLSSLLFTDCFSSSLPDEGVGVSSLGEVVGAAAANSFLLRLAASYITHRHTQTHTHTQTQCRHTEKQLTQQINVKIEVEQHRALTYSFMEFIVGKQVVIVWYTLAYYEIRLVRIK